MTKQQVEAADTEQARQTIWNRALILSEELRKSARAIRQTKSTAAVRWRLFEAGVPSYRRFSKLHGDWRQLAGIVLGFVLPAIAALAYINFGMSNQYMSEARFAVRGGERVTADPISALTGLASFTQAQDSLIVANYVKSRAVVEELDRTVGLRQLYSHAGIDWLSRFNAKRPIEDLVKYWRWKIATNIESPSGIITIQVNAFSPSDALKIANAVVASSEKLINAMSARALQDAMEEAQSELTRAEKNLGDVRVELQNLRNSQSTLNPYRTAEGVNKLIGELRLERARLEEEAHFAQRSQVDDSAPQMQLLRVRIQVVGDQISALERELTSAAETPAMSISGKITQFDELELKHQIAEKQYTLAAAAFERARLNAERQKVYLATFVAPVLAQDADWPKRPGLSIAALIAVAALYWMSAAALSWIARLVGSPLLGRGN